MRSFRPTSGQQDALRNAAFLLSLVSLSAACVMSAGCQQRGEATAAPASDRPAKDLRADDSGSGEQAAAEKPAEASGVSLQLLDYAGIEQLIASHRGQVVVMDAWATSCPPCLREFPKLVALSHRFAADELACISLSFDYQGIGQPADKLPRVAAFLEQQQATFDNVLASEDSDILYRKFHLASVPAVFVYDRAGELRQRFDNQKARSEAEHYSYEDVERLVAELVAEPAPADGAGAGPAAK